jgi:hypothetical protein
MGQFVHLSSSWFFNVHDPRAFFEKLPSIPLKHVPQVNLRKGKISFAFSLAILMRTRVAFGPFP